MGSNKSQKVGTKWLWGQHLVLCHAPLDAIKRIWFGEQVGWAGHCTDNETIRINKPTLFGEADVEGGVSGNVDVLFGGVTQGVNPYLEAQIGQPISAFRHLVSLVFNQVYMGNSPYPPTISFEASRTQIGWNGLPIWQQALADTGNGMNAAHIIYELITSYDWGAGKSNVHEAQFLAVAQTLYDERFGLNLFWNKQQPVEEAIKDICKYINAVVFNDEETGLVSIKLVRSDYDADKLPVLTDKNIRTVRNVKRRSTVDAVNTLTLTYTDPETYNEATIVVRNAALLRATNRIVAESVNYPMIHDAQLAYQVAMRELKLLSTRLMAADIYCDTTAGAFQPGDVIKVVLPDAGLDHVMRVSSKKRGAASNPEITLSVVEDIFSPTFGSYVPPPPSDWIPPDYDVYPVTLQSAIEAPYWYWANTLSTSELNIADAESGVVLWQGVAPSQESLSAEINYNHTDEWKYSHHAAFTPFIVIEQPLTQDASTAIVTTSSTLVLPAICQLDDELIVITAINEGSIATITRGVLDTIPQEHEEDTIAYSLNNDAINAEFMIGEHVSLLPLTVTPNQQLSPDSAMIIGIDIVARAFKPLSVCNVRLNDEYWPDTITLPLTIEWSHRNRLSEVVLANDLSSWYTDSVGEPGTQTHVRVMDVDGNNIVDKITDETSVELTTLVSPTITIELTAIKDGVESFQVARLVCNVNNSV